ncbi:MAG: DUF3365 domain-containing protein [Desulfurivibrionaceae bacterium]|nr:DUF3365 domain-containing protein [Desulfurivibrionaceae bacterium]
MATQKKSFRPGLGLYLNFGLALVLVIMGIYLIHAVQQEERHQALLEAEKKAELILDHNLATHTYFSHTLKPKVFELLRSSEQPSSYFEPAWMSSTFAVREIDNHFKSLTNEDYYYKECAINARNPANEADAFERAFIKELNSTPELDYRSLIRNINGHHYYVTLRRGEVMEKTCLRCHSTPDKAPQGLVDTYGSERSFQRHENEVISAISIRVPLSAAYERAAIFSRHLSKIFIISLLIIFAIQYLIHRFLVIRPITRLKEKASRISENEELLGREIALPLTRELRELTTTFNTMSLKLSHHMDTLEEKVRERTSELQATNDELQKALTEIKTLQGIIPICMHCKGIRDDKGYWNKLEKYLYDHAGVEFSHGICEKCLKKYYPDLEKE